MISLLENYGFIKQDLVALIQEINQRKKIADVQDFVINAKINDRVFKFLYPDDNNNANMSNILKPREYQIEAYNALKDKQRTVLQLPCGMGKTLISIMLASLYELVIFISPLKAFCEQNMNSFTKQLQHYCY